MKKIIFCFLMGALCLTLNAVILCNCSLVAGGAYEPANTTTSNTIELTLPTWPPASPSPQYYPPLSRWLIRITSAENQSTFYTTEQTISVPEKQNRPFCVTVQPITYLQDGNECSYFKPAGYMYPFSETDGGVTWEQGYLASIMQRLIYESVDECLPPVEIEYLVNTFNWKKAQQTIQKKMDTSELFYNPWLVPQTQILEGITSHSFKASLLNATGSVALKLSDLPAPTANSIQFLSSFIPENQTLHQKNQFTVIKNSPIIISDGNSHAVFITYKSAKNISLEFIFLPIYIEDI